MEEIKKEQTTEESAKEYYNQLVSFRVWRESHGGVMYSPYDRARQYNEWAAWYYGSKGIPYEPVPVEELAYSMQSPMEIMLRKQYASKDNCFKRLIKSIFQKK